LRESTLALADRALESSLVEEESRQCPRAGALARKSAKSKVRIGSSWRSATAITEVSASPRLRSA
jgi:hypothetical protein